ncbi:MAG: tRNA threonylcarbamoyladenosine biosynthesis protein TsaB [Verrucomicrobia subdivision 3 bacterium]|nr:tRNA threonylcarbamoyladenosine biosynthesis protein TsaB [Limisphaerales bacterium]MCS1413528.1 tRNA threonylcarbamoyladenosine biosynthesis protein TsaB [Limisphaerales bacterium]
MSAVFLMKILAIDSSSRVRSVAFCCWDVGRPFEVVVQASSASQRGGRLASLIEEVLEVAGQERSVVERIVVGVGPGSAAGIRSTLAFALGWSAARGTEVTGISSIWALAARVRKERLAGRVMTLVQGPSGRVYTAAFQVAAEGVSEVNSLKLVSQGQLRDAVGGWDYLVGPEVLDILDTASGDPQPSFLGALPPQLALTPTAGALGWLVSEGYDHLDQPLEPLSLASPGFVKASPPRSVPER